MRGMSRLGGWEITLLFLILAGAAGARIWYLTEAAQNGMSPGPVQVQDRRDDLDELARSLSESHGYAGPAGALAHPAPLYPWLLSQFYRISPSPAASQQLARWLQCALGASTAALYFLFARQAFSSLLVAALAGLLTAFHPFWIINTAEIDDGVLTTFLLALCLFLGVQGGKQGGFLTTWCYGLSLAGLALTRAALLPFAFIALLWFLLRCRSFPRGWMPALLACLGFVSGLAPWLIRNYRVFHDVYPIVDSTYYHLWLGNHANGSGGRPAGEPQVPRSTEPTPLTDRARAQAIFEEVKNNPARELERRLWAGLYFFFGEDWFKERRLWRVSDTDDARAVPPAWLARYYPAILCGSLLVMLLLGVLGWRWSYLWSEESMPAALAMIWIPLPYLLSHAEALQGPRLPLDGLLLCYAAYALAWLVSTVANLRLSNHQ